MKMGSLFDKIKQEKSIEKDSELARYLGIKQQTVASQRTKEPSTTILYNLLKAFEAKTAEEAMKADVLWPIVEYFPVTRVNQSRGDDWLVFDPGSNPFRQGLREYLDQTKFGVYVFFDSVGKPTYVGKTQGATISLWRELTNAFNRKMKFSVYEEQFNADAEFQTVKARGNRVKPAKVSRRLCDVAKYFSAYGTSRGAAHGMEALLIRVMANALWNDQVPNFSPGK